MDNNFILISHRGNLHGREQDSENHPDRIDCAIGMGYDVEVDVWSDGDRLLLGHDAGQYLIDKEWLLQRASRLWIHAKNQAALEGLSAIKTLNVFWHETDRMTLTSQGKIWLYPGNFSKHGITVFLGKPTGSIESAGVCTDYPIDWSRWNVGK